MTINDNEGADQNMQALETGEAKRTWHAPTLKTFPTERTEGKDFVNVDEGFITSGPS